MTDHDRPRAVVLLSGGLDSATALAEAKAQGFATYALTMIYGQRHAIELEAARKVARAFGVVRHVEQAIDLRVFGGSALVGEGDVPKGRTVDAMTHGIPSTYVPARNTVFLSLALAWAETLGAFDLFVGVNCVDYSGYPDCRPEYLRAFETLANLATKAGVEGAGAFRIHAPFARTDQGADHRPGSRTWGRLWFDSQLLRPIARWPRLRPVRLVFAPPGRVRRPRARRPGPVRRARAPSHHRARDAPDARRGQIRQILVERCITHGKRGTDPPLRCASVPFSPTPPDRAGFRRGSTGRSGRAVVRPRPG